MSHLASPLAMSLGGDSGAPLTPDERDTFEMLVSLWPPGVRDLYDLDTDGGDVRRYFEALAQMVTRFGTQMVDDLRTEIVPYQAVERLPDWEAVLGLPATRHPPTTIAGRQAAVLAKLREHGSYSRAELRALIAPLLGYVNPSTLVIYETDRSALRTAHAYAGAGFSISGVGSATIPFYVADDGVVSQGGARVTFANWSASNYSTLNLTVTLTGPDGTVATLKPKVGAATSHPCWTFGHSGKPILGLWTLYINNTLVTNTVSADSCSLFVEGARLDSAGNNGLGGVQFEFACYADPALEGAVSGTDHDAARAALRRVQPAHTAGAVITVKSGVKPGALVPSEFIPNNVA